MSVVCDDEYIQNVSSGNVGQLTEMDEDSDISCVYLHFDCSKLISEGADSLYLTRADLFRLLAELEEA